MKEPIPLRAISPESNLKVSYKAPASLNVFLSNLPDAVIITDSHFIIKAINQAAVSFFGKPSSHFIGTVLEKYIQFEFRNTSKENAIRELFESGIWNGEICVKGKNNLEFIFSSNVSLLYDKNGGVSDLVFVNHNITEAEKRQKQIASIKNKYEIVVESLSEGVLLFNAFGKIAASNLKASEILGISDGELKDSKININTWDAVNIDGSPFRLKDFPAFISLKTGKEINGVVIGIKKTAAERVWISVNSRAIFKDGNSMPDSVVASFKDITPEKKATEQLKESELLFRSFMSNTPMLGWIFDEDGNLVYGNSLFLESMGLEIDADGNYPENISTSEYVQKIISRNGEVLEKTESMITEDELIMKDGTKKYFLSNWFLIPGKSKRMIGGQAIDITEKIQAHQYIEKMHERFTYAVNASSDAIWDLDLKTNEIYRSDAFSKISGYPKEEIASTIDWWFKNIHPDDKDRVHNKVEAGLANRSSNWEDEYRFLHADGTYRVIHDKGFTIYENNIATRQIGSMQDITERKKLESDLLFEQVQKQKLINQATINAQEEERNRISGELHDNVNQLLISSRLHIGVAKNNPDKQDELLEKATEYLLMAVEEIRALSKRMNSHIVAAVGLEESIADITYNMEKINNISTVTYIERDLVGKLTDAQQLMVFRIVQEQSNNIIKHAEASEATFCLKESGNECQLEITDNGKGFATDSAGRNGLGFINIFNRVDAYNGKVVITSSEGNGCKLDIIFPLG